MTRGRRLSAQAVSVCVFAVVGIAIFPFYWMLVTATNPDQFLFADTMPLLPRPTYLGIFRDVFSMGHVSIWLRNSAIVAAGTCSLALVLALPIAYGLSRFSFRGKMAAGLGLLMTQMLPEAMLVVPLFSIFATANMLNSYTALILANASFTLPVITWIIKNAIDTVPVELEEAGVLDGCSTLGVLTRIILPIIAPSTAAAAVISFFHGWNEYVFALTFITDDNLRTASVGLASFVGEISTPVQSVMTVGIIYTLPAVALYLLLQRFIVSGMAAGSVKG